MYSERGRMQGGGGGGCCAAAAAARNSAAEQTALAAAERRAERRVVYSAGVECNAMQCRGYKHSAGRVQCIAVYIRVDRRAQCDDDVLTAALRVLASNSKSACCPATRGALTAAACTQKHKHFSRRADRRTLNRNTIYHVTMLVSTRVRSSALWQKRHLLLPSDSCVSEAL